MRFKSLVACALAVCLSAAPLAAFAEQPGASPVISPFVNYEEIVEYKLGRYDTINIVIIGYPNADMFSNIRIGLDGYVNLPLIGIVKLGGLTIAEARALLTEKLSEYLKITDLSVMVSEYGARQVYIMGEVTSPGIYDFHPTAMNVFAAISRAGGITRRGRPKHIAVIRVSGNEMLMREINLDSFIKKHDMSQNLALSDGDMIYVPRVNKIILHEDVLPLLTTFGIIRAVTR